jgi:hypothetical protein
MILPIAASLLFGIAPWIQEARLGRVKKAE